MSCTDYIRFYHKALHFYDRIESQDLRFPNLQGDIDYISCKYDVKNHLTNVTHHTKYLTVFYVPVNVVAYIVMQVMKIFNFSLLVQSSACGKLQHPKFNLNFKMITEFAFFNIRPQVMSAVKLNCG